MARIPRRKAVPKGRKPEPGSEGVPSLRMNDPQHTDTAKVIQKKQATCSAIFIAI
jgi:hypothetical protein